MARSVFSLLALLGALPCAAADNRPPRPEKEPPATAADKVRIRKDFKVELLYSVPKDQQGSWVNLCVDPKGRLITSDQYGSLYRITPPALGAPASQTKVEKLDVAIGEAQGLLWVKDSLYVVVNRGRKYESGLYRVRSSKGDDHLDKVELLRKISDGAGEHGPHGVVLGPDKKSLYIVCGNMTKMQELASSRVPRVWGEDHLLPRMPDGNGFMAGVLGPGGCIYHTDLDGKHWQLISTGYRNPFDIAFNRLGDLFTYDADMEWDMNTPWYRPTRVCLAASGSEFGWRNGTGKWPAYYLDSLPAILDIGPGSPTGITFGYGAKFPARYQEALFLCDWSYGKLYAVHLTPEGSGYKGQAEEFLNGSPLPLTDVVINPRDGALYFTIGGRQTKSGLYRVTYTGSESTEPVVLDTRGAAARAERRKLESFHSTHDPQAVATAWPYLKSPDRFLRFAARVAIEHQDPKLWQDRALAEKDPEASLQALIALVRVRAVDPAHNKGVMKKDEALKSRVMASLARLDWDQLSDDQRLELLRVYAVTFVRLGPPDEATRKRLIARFDAHYPASNRFLNGELCQLLVYLEAPSVVGKTLKMLAAAPTQEEQIEYVKSLRRVERGWTPAQRKEYFEWFLKAAHYKGGSSFGNFVKNIKNDAVKTLTEKEKTALKSILEARSDPRTALPGVKNRPFVRKWKLDELATLVEKELKQKRDFDRGRRLFGEASCFSCHRFANEGGAAGPDLTGVAGRFSVRDLLESILDPNKEISDQYAAVNITTTDGKVISGRIVNFSGDSIIVMTNMLDPNGLTNVSHKKVESVEISKVSMMPVGLLETFHADEVADLLAYLLSGGDRNKKTFSPPGDKKPAKKEEARRDPLPGLVPENVARGKPATASSSQDADRSPDRAVDGDRDSRWCADGPKAGSWWQVDLGKPQELTGCRIVWEFGGKAYRYRIEGSADGRKWSPLAAQTKDEPIDQVQTHRFRAEGVRFFRVTVTGLPEGLWPSFYECEVFGTRLVKPDAAARAAYTDPRGLLANVKAPPGFEVTLFAAPPDVAYPTCLAATSDGTVFVGVDRNGSLGARPQRGEVVRCIDTDGDGKADKLNTFAKMDSPRGLWFDNNTLYVLHPPYLSAFYDDDGDGKADRSEVLVSGLGFELKRRGADHTTNGFRMGIDGWFYIAVGDYGAFQAKGKDGTKVQLYGGGVMRVRPDGSGLEVVSRGQRNIYDVAVSPRLDLFTRDNTNDGGGWDVRLSHVVPTGNYGYPTSFVHFADEIVQPLADYGGGAPCGSLFLDEVGYPPDFGTGLYTCDWGRSEVYLHPLTPNGASWKAGQQVFLRIPRPTDIDTDGRGHLYVSSWKDGGFDYSGPNIGFVVCLTPKDHKPVAFPDLKKASDAELLGQLAGASGVGRLYAQREILRRGVRAELVAGLEKQATAEGPLAGRVAALFTLKQLQGERSHEALLRLARLDALREYALRALADNKKELASVPMQPFLDGLKDADPRVRLQAAIGLGRLGKVSAAPALLPLTVDTDPIVAHVAVNALIALRAHAACLKALDTAASPKEAAGALRVLQELHEPAVVDGLLARYEKATNPGMRPALLTVLARLYQREADWDGSWWGTRPDTTGPYFKPVTWAASSKIAVVLRRALADADVETLRWLLPLYQRMRVDLPETTPVLLKLADKGADLRRLAVEVFTARSTPPAEAVALLSAVAASPEEKSGLRIRALRALMHRADNPSARDGIIAGLTAGAKLPGELEPVWNEYVRDGRHVGAVTFFTRLAADASPARRELAQGVLATIASRNLGSLEARAAAARVVNEAWKDPTAQVPLLHVVKRLGLASYAPEVRRLLKDANLQVAAAAKNAAAALKLDGSRGNEPTIGSLKFEQAVARVKKSKGDASLGMTLFNRIGCINCHTVSPSEPPKGPFLGGIATRYSKDELLESILKPSVKIAQGFETSLFTLTNGRVLTGFVVRESGTEVELRDSTGATTTVKKSKIEERTPSKVSVMPENLVDTLTPHELASILAYLESLKGK